MYSPKRLSKTAGIVASQSLTFSSSPFTNTLNLITFEKPLGIDNIDVNSSSVEIVISSPSSSIRISFCYVESILTVIQSNNFKMNTEHKMKF